MEFTDIVSFILLYYSFYYAWSAFPR